MPLTTAHPLASNRSSSEELNRIVEALKQSLVSNDSINEELQLNVNQGNEMKSNGNDQELEERLASIALLLGEISCYMR